MDEGSHVRANRHDSRDDYSDSSPKSKSNSQLNKTNQFQELYLDEEISTPAKLRGNSRKSTKRRSFSQSDHFSAIPKLQSETFHDLDPGYPSNLPSEPTQYRATSTPFSGNLLSQNYTGRSKILASIDRKRAMELEQADPTTTGISKTAKTITSDEIIPVRSSAENTFKFSKMTFENVKEIEFDSSDRDLPIKRQGLKTRKSHDSKKVESLNSKSLVQKIQKSPKSIKQDSINFDLRSKKSPEVMSATLISSQPAEKLPVYVNMQRTPRRKSPLRKQILPSSSPRTVVSELVSEVARSGALLDKSRREILDEINSSFDKLRAQDPDKASSSLDSEDDILNSLPSLPTTTSEWILPRLQSENILHIDERSESGEGNGGSEMFEISDGGSKHVELSDDSNIFHEKSSIAKDSFGDNLFNELLDFSKIFSKHQIDSNPSELGSPVYSKPRSARPEELPSQPTRTKRQKPESAYEEWLIARWDKLQRLIHLSIPMSVLLNSLKVRQALNCSSREELEKRISFLMGYSEL